MKENTSIVVAFRQQQALQEQAAQQGLSGLAAVAQHNAINKRMERRAEYVLQLVQQGKHEEVKALILSDNLWGEE